MYDAPEISFSILKQLSEFFGTDEINVDNFSHGGCETCDWGSEYGHEIRIDNATLNFNHPNFNGKNLLQL